VALAVAAARPVEIISVDSALVYRGMDIGTAKPTPQERAAVPHHLIDILDPRDAYSAAQFVKDTLARVDAIHARGRVPLLVGGTMMYFHALRQGLHDMPPADAAVRATIDQEAAALGWPAMHAELARVDAVTADRLAPNDSQRVQRALEVWRVSGRALSDWHAVGRAAAPPTAAQWPVVSLEPQSRAWLHERIDARLRHMVTAGFIDEVHQLRARGDLHLGLPSMRCVGYRQAWLALDQGSLTGFHPAALAATRQLAKRQLTWLRSIPDRVIVPCDGLGAPSTAVQQVIHAIDCMASNLL
jgi:tRNA dimethylallyltransferase